MHKWGHICPANDSRRGYFRTFSHLRLEMTVKHILLGLLVVSFGTSCAGHGEHDKEQMPLDYVRYPYQAMYPGDDSVTADAIFSGITTFAKLPWVQCLTKDKDVPFDIAFLGAPFVSL